MTFVHFTRRGHKILTNFIEGSYHPAPLYPRFSTVFSVISLKSNLYLFAQMDDRMTHLSTFQIEGFDRDLSI